MTRNLLSGGAAPLPGRAAIEEDRSQLEELVRACADRAIAMAEWMAARGPIEHRVKAAEARLVTKTMTNVVDGYVGNADALRVKWTRCQSTGSGHAQAPVVAVSGEFRGHERGVCRGRGHLRPTSSAASTSTPAGP